jgi:hypothetical protein
MKKLTYFCDLLCKKYIFCITRDVQLDNEVDPLCNRYQMLDPYMTHHDYCTLTYNLTHTHKPKCLVSLDLASLL